MFVTLEFSQGKHVMHELGTGRTWVFDPKLTDSIYCITNKIRDVLRANMPAGGVMLRGKKNPIYTDTDVASGVYVNWGIHNVLQVRSEFDVKVGNASCTTVNSYLSKSYHAVNLYDVLRSAESGG